MSPIRAEKRQKSPGGKGRVLLAVSSPKKPKIRGIRKAARQSQVPRTTLKRRLDGIPFRGGKTRKWP